MLVVLKGLNSREWPECHFRKRANAIGCACFQRALLKKEVGRSFSTTKDKLSIVNITIS